jgi:hypothetical protein
MMVPAHFMHRIEIAMPSPPIRIGEGMPDDKLLVNRHGTAPCSHGLKGQRITFMLAVQIRTRVW